jgi:hypothetical protein
MSQTIDVLNHLSSLNPPKILLEFESADDRNSATYYFKLLGQFIISHVLTNTEGYVDHLHIVHVCIFEDFNRCMDPLTCIADGFLLEISPRCSVIKRDLPWHIHQLLKMY